MRSVKLAPRATAKINLLSDVVCVVGCAVLARVLQHARVTPETLLVAGAAACAWLIGSFVLRFYDPWSRRMALDDAALLSLLVLGEAVFFAGIHFLFGREGLPRTVDFILLLWPVVLTLRLFIYRRLVRLEPPIDDVLIAGIGHTGRCTAEELATHRWPRRRVAGFLRFSDEPNVDQVQGIPVVGTVTEIERALKAFPVDEVYFAALPQKEAGEMQNAIASCERLGMPFALPACPFRLGRAQLSHPTAATDGFLHFINTRTNPQQAALKRLFDIGASALALVVLSPLFATVAALIKLTSRGPVLFKQQRVGLYGRPFHMLKFRSMVVNAEELKEKLAAQNEQTGPVFKMKNDPRITKVGRFIRKFSIDELPQLVNVLRGDMSVVGPRPPVPKEVAQYEDWQRRRLSVRPGLTCIWQVSGRNEISFRDWMYLDMRYIDHWSLAEDVKLIAKTFPVVLTGRGAS